ncbi:MAG: HAD family hydrolase [archaeon]|jgi:phosphoglycolate phosphatase-like HAD superfamily hydrolase
MNKAVIFDWSGTISDNFHLFCKVVDKMHVYFGKELISPIEIRNTFTIPYMKFWNHHFPKLSKSEQDVLYKKFILEVGSPEVFLGVKDTLLYLKKKGFLLFVVSADNPSTLFPEMTKFGLDGVFSEVCCSIHEKEGPIKMLVEKHFLDKENSYYIGDTSGDVEAGKIAGIKTIGVSWGFQSKKNLAKAKPDYLIDDLNELKNIL